MAKDDTGAGADDAPPKKSKMPVLIGLLLAVALGGGGFYAGVSGLLSAHGATAAHETSVTVPDLPDLAFVEIEPVLIALAREADSRHLRFRGNLEVAAKHEREVVTLMPRILDVLNSYLRAVEIRQLEDPAALLRLRAQMLRRVQIVTGEGRVRDLLISEFVLN